LADSTTSRVSYTLDSSIESVNKIEQTAELCATSAGFDEDTVSNISMAIREAAVNAVLHGNAYDANKSVKASFETTSGRTYHQDLPTRDRTRSRHHP
jgi:serine/threonine-protein kinase RsbW